MRGLVQDDFTRAALFFSIAFGCMILGGLVIGDLRTGVRWGLGLGAAFGVFAYFFIRPTGVESIDSPDSEK